MPVKMPQTTEIIEGNTEEKGISEQLEDVGPEHLKERHKVL